MSSRVRRIITRALVVLLLGAMFNLAIAWSCGERTRLPRGASRDALSPEQASELWRVHGTGPPPYSWRPTGWQECGTFTTVTWFGTSLLANEGRFQAFGVASPRANINDMLIIESGWPIRCLSHVQSSIVSPATLPGAGLPVSNHVRWLREATFLWPGFAINTLFYAAILWGLFAAPFALRRRRRIKRGLCPACAYPIGTSEVCTECGAAVKPRATEVTV